MRFLPFCPKPLDTGTKGDIIYFMETKGCPSCGETKRLDKFHKDRSRKNGITTYCAQCRNATQLRKYHENRDEMKRKMRAWSQTPQGKASQLKRKKRYIEKYPERWEAFKFLRYCISKGAIPPVNSLICKHCGEQAEEYHHYAGYEPSNWLKIIPLCISCHKIEHRDKTVKN